MSNTQVGSIYQQIISDVVESSRVDFEEGGVEEQVLEELRQVRPLSKHTAPSHDTALLTSHLIFTESSPGKYRASLTASLCPSCRWKGLLW